MAANTGNISLFLDLVGVIIVVIDSDQKVSYINKKGCEILGYEKDDILGKNWFDMFLPEKIRKEIKEVFNLLVRGEIELVEYFDNVIVTKSGQERTIGWHNTVLRDDSGKIIGTLSLGDDITERRMIDEKVVQELQNRVTELESTRIKIPVCTLNKKDLKDAIRRHYRYISTEGKCPECLDLLRMFPKKKE